MFNLVPDIGVDLGTASVLVYVKGKGIVLKEPSVVAINKDNGQIIAVGTEARRMLGRTPGNIVAIRPLREGVIADFDVTEKMLRYFIDKVGCRKFLFRPRIMVCIPAQVTGVEERAVRQAALQAGAKQAYVIEEPVAAALGAGIDIAQASGSMIVDIGGGTTDVAVMSLGGVVSSASIKVGGDKFDDAIVRYVRKEFNLMIGERTAEEVKIEIGTANPGAAGEKRSISIRGRDVMSGLPKAVEITSEQVFEAIQEPLAGVLQAVREVLENTPPELSADLIHKGIILTGGGSLLDGLDTLLAKETGLPAALADDPISCVALGTGKALSMLNALPQTREGKVSERVG
ncbi:MAG: rod shape-determining protein [Peptococcaceae bacterium]|nr:rod shape-determining protein [Peptococcaceae bacterium]